jgi:hypothetical protein
MKINSILIMILLNLSLVSAMSEFDTLGQIISSSFYSGKPVSEKFISDWADSCSPELSHRIYEQYNFPEDDTKINEQEELAEGMSALLDETIETTESITAFHSTLNKLDPNKKIKIMPLLFNYMYR